MHWWEKYINIVISKKKKLWKYSPPWHPWMIKGLSLSINVDLIPVENDILPFVQINIIMTINDY